MRGEPSRTPPRTRDLTDGNSPSGLSSHIAWGKSGGIASLATGQRILVLTASYGSKQGVGNVGRDGAYRMFVLNRQR